MLQVQEGALGPLLQQGHVPLLRLPLLRKARARVLRLAEGGRTAGRKPPDHTNNPGERIDIILIGDERGIEEAHLLFSHDTILLSPGILTFIQIMSNGQLTDIDWMVNDFIEGKNPSEMRIGEVTVEATFLADSTHMIFKR